MKFERPDQSNIIDSLFQDDEQFEKAVKAALKESRRGGYEVGTPGFTRMVVGNINLEPHEFGQLKKQINIAIHRIEKAEERKPKERTKNEIMADDARAIQEEEYKRTGIHPEDLNEI